MWLMQILSFLLCWRKLLWYGIIYQSNWLKGKEQVNWHQALKKKMNCSPANTPKKPFRHSTRIVKVRHTEETERVGLFKTRVNLLSCITKIFRGFVLPFLCHLFFGTLYWYVYVVLVFIITFKLILPVSWSVGQKSPTYWIKNRYV